MIVKVLHVIQNYEIATDDNVSSLGSSLAVGHGDSKEIQTIITIGRVDLNGFGISTLETYCNALVLVNCSMHIYEACI